MKTGAGKLKLMVLWAAFAVVVLTAAVCEQAAGQWGGGGGFGGRDGAGGRGGAGKNPMEEICNKNPDLCELMKEMKDFCDKAGAYCEMAGLKVFSGGSGDHGDHGRHGDRGGPGDHRDTGKTGGPGTRNSGHQDAMRDAMTACRNGGDECEKSIAELRERLDLAKGMKELCDGKDSEACGVVKDTEKYCGENADLCRDTQAGLGKNAKLQNDQGNENGSVKEEKSLKSHKDLIDACRAGAENCGELKTKAKSKLDLLKELKEVCSKDKNSDECGQMKELVSVCESDAEKCGQMKARIALCKESPDECEKAKEQDQKEDIEKMKDRCSKNPGLCEANIKQKREFCNSNPGDCDKDMLEMLDEMETYIARLKEESDGN